MLRFALATLVSIVAARASGQEIPLLLDVRMEPVAGAEKELADSGPGQIDGALRTGASFIAEGKRKSAIRFSGERARRGSIPSRSTASARP